MKPKPSDVTPKELFDQRRSFLKLGAASVVATGSVSNLLAALKTKAPSPLSFIPSENLENLKPNSFEQASGYVNFYEFSTSKTAL